MSQNVPEPSPRWASWPGVALGALGLVLLTVLVGAALGRQWVAVGGAVTGAWVALGATVIMYREGVLPGFRQSGDRVGLFGFYRKRSNLVWSFVTYAAALLLGLSPLLTDVSSSRAPGLIALLFAVSSVLPLEFYNWWMARRVGDRPGMRQALALWLPAMLKGQALSLGLLLALRHTHPHLLEPVHVVTALGFGPLMVLFYVSAHRITLGQSEVAQALQRADAADTARHLAEARLAVLQAQIEPHFLFNTLATVEYLIKSDPVTAAVLLNQLTRYLRLAMPSMRQLSSTLGREFELTDAYLQIAKLRMGGRLAVDVDLPDALLATEFPALVVQTLVENAIKHGVEPKPGPVRIRVFARQVGAELHVGVQDDGVGLSGMAAPDGGTGLQNIRERLRGLHGERAQLSVVGLAEGGVLATVVVPLDKP